MPQTPDPLPRWYRVLRATFVRAYVAIAIGCVAAVFLMMIIGAVIYRDFDSYTLAGNPWDPSGFPWYVIWPMRLMSIVGIQALVAIGFYVLFALGVVVWPARIGSPVVKGIGIGAVVVALELAAGAWFGRWFG